MSLRFSIPALAIALFALGCGTPNGLINRVHGNLVDKAIFEGEWWTLQSVVEADGDATAVGRGASLYMFNGGSAFTDLALDNGQSASIGRIRWVIDENFLYAYRSYELIDGGNDDGRNATFRGQPLAAFRIETHVDVRRTYDELTGELTNVVQENTTDRRWYERDFMRVDWSMNHAQSFAYLTDYVALEGQWRRESTAFLQEPGSHPDFPRSWAPQFVRVSDDPDYRWADEWPSEMQDAVHYMSFTTMTLFSPGASCLFIGGGPCQTVSVPVRTAFLRIPPNHTYEAAQQSHQEFDRFGTFRTYQRTYVRGGQDPAGQATFCASDAHCGDLVAGTTCEFDDDCGAGAACACPPGVNCEPDQRRCYDMARGRACNTEQNVCTGGLTSDLGELDFLNFSLPRHNFYRESLTDRACVRDWQCNNQYGTGGTPGSTCDRVARRCTIPVAQREIRQVPYHLNDGFPPYLVKAAYETMGYWNEVFMRGWRVTTGRGVPRYADVTVPTQTTDPTAYCFAGSADDADGDGSCPAKFDPFVSPAEWESRGVTNPYDCQIVNADGWDEPARPESYSQYPIPSAYRWEFVGSECMFILKTNKCDWWREDAGTHCDDVRDDQGAFVRWEQQGDIRYQFYNFINQVGTYFGGVSELRADPTNGELITADANFASVVTENMTMTATEWFQVLRCTGPNGCGETDDPRAAERWVAGDQMRDYFGRISGRVELPIGIAPSGADGFSNLVGGGRPAMPVGNLRSELMMERIAEVMPRVENLRGEGARFNIFQDRLRNVAGTPVEANMMEAIGREGLNAHFANTASPFAPDAVDLGSAQLSDRAVLDTMSPFRGMEHVRTARRDDELAQRARMVGYDFQELTDPRNFLRGRYWEYWAEAFRDRPLGEASIRMQQMQMKGVQYHEVGHSVGLRHNFGGSFDRNNYGDGYFNLVVGQGLQLPRYEDFDANGNGYLENAELNAYGEALRTARNERARRGAHNYMTGSIMDYNGDPSDSMGLGRYDIAATMWSHFGLVEAYVGDPRVERRLNPLLNPLHASHTTERVWWQTYVGGESCVEDSDCSGPGFGDQPVFQRCVKHPRYSRLQTACGGDRNCVCSNFDKDFQDYFFGAAPYNNDVDGDRVVDHYPVRYLFCGDERANDLSWCSVFDAGESFTEAVDHYRRDWYERYANSYNRRFLRRGPAVASSIRAIIDVAKMYQHLFFRIFYEPGFEANRGPDSGPMGLDDQLEAATQGMNWLMELVNLPDEGSYRLNADRNVYEHVSENQVAGSDFFLRPGDGFGMWTKFQEGHQGFFRAERGGVFWDKFYALFALAIRDWGLSFTIDERFFINYYDLYATEITEFFGGIILDDPRWFAPRVVDAGGGNVNVVHMQNDRGLLFGNCNVGGARVPCGGNRDTEYPEPALGGTTNTVLRSWATMLALAQFAVFYDSSFEQRLIIFRKGDGTGHQIPDVQRDGSPACAYGSILDASSPHNVVGGGDPTCDSAEDATYVVYDSERLHTPYVAVKVRPRFTYNLEEEQLGFQVLRQLVDLQDDLNQAIADGAAQSVIDAKRIRLQEQESFVEYIIQLQAMYGISNYFGI